MAFVAFRPGSPSDEMWTPWLQRPGEAANSSARLDELVELLNDDTPDAKFEASVLKPVEADEKDKSLEELNSESEGPASSQLSSDGEEIENLFSHLTPRQVETIKKTTSIIDRSSPDCSSRASSTSSKSGKGSGSEGGKRKATSVLSEDKDERQKRLKKQRSANEKKRCAECKRLGRAKCRVHGPLLEAAARANGGVVPKGPAFAKFEYKLKEAGLLVSALKLAVSEQTAGFCAACREKKPSTCPLHGMMHELTDGGSSPQKKKKVLTAPSTPKTSRSSKVSSVSGRAMNPGEMTPGANVKTALFSAHSPAPSSSTSSVCLDDEEHESESSDCFSSNFTPLDPSEITYCLDAESLSFSLGVQDWENE
mmetsp:Transcript_29897/g.77175  ORF Transcript_29897/g.77175 Transcript_29897/m.77175 type:complete len:367 (-) Transcript_29897:856-1956(-)